MMTKKNIYMLVSCTIAMICVDCSSDSVDEPPVVNDNAVTVDIETTVQTRANVTLQFADGNEMNVFAKTYNKVDAPDLVENVKGTYDSNRWNLTPAIKLNEGEHAFIYALSPYKANLNDLSNIPINIADQQDVLYSGNPVPVSHTTHVAKLTMKHALSLLTFNIGKHGYTGNGMLQNLSVSGEEVYTSGKMNIETGKIIPTGKEKYVMNVEKTIDGNGWSEELPRMWNIPFTTKGCTAYLTAIIDGKTYETKFPEVEMRTGYQYIFRLVLTNYGLEFIPGQTETISLNSDEDTMEPLENYGVLLIGHTNSAFTLPLLNGDNVFGSVDWGDGNRSSYEPGGLHNYTDNQEVNSVIIECWNANGFTLQYLSGVESIDFSQF